MQRRDKDNKKMDSTILITGGTGFVGSNLAVGLKRSLPDTKVICLDNLKRRGSELNLPRLKELGIEFLHGDIRNREDLELPGTKVKTIIECSAEPSVLAGYDASPYYVLNSNLVGTINCLEAARRLGADVVFLSTSRVYPIATLNAVSVEESDTRFELSAKQPLPGVSARGIAEDFPLEGPRSLYGATKLSSELIAQEYSNMYGIRTVINRCGVIAGPWQMGKVDQGVFALWMLSHYFKKDLSYIGFGGTGKQVRDLLHIDDLLRLVEVQLSSMDAFNGNTYNVGGGAEVSLSLVETTRLCEEISGNRIKITKADEDRPGDIRLYITDNTKVTEDTGWAPKAPPEKIMKDIFDWIRENEEGVRQALL